MKSLRLYLRLEGPPSRLLPSTPIEKHFVAVRASAHSLRRFLPLSLVASCF